MTKIIANTPTIAGWTPVRISPSTPDNADEIGVMDEL
jgi:hypothetical protein